MCPAPERLAVVKYVLFIKANGQSYERSPQWGPVRLSEIPPNAEHFEE